MHHPDTRTRWRLVVALLLPVAAGAQAPRALTLSPLSDVLTGEFSSLTSVRELSTGQVLLTDARENRLVVADFRTQQVKPVGRRGAGPGEWTHTAQLIPLRGDTSVMINTVRREWVYVDGAARTWRLPPTSPLVLLDDVAGVDRNGTALLLRSPRETPEGMVARRTDSVAVVLATLAGSRLTMDTVAKLAPPWLPPGTKTLPKDFTYETARLAPDGWLAVLRLDPGRVEWRSPQGTWTRGPALALKKGDPGYRAAPPAVLLPDGRLLALAVATGGRGERLYDLINRKGEREARLALPNSEYVLGFGARSVYVVTGDDDGIQHLRRHPWP